ncbi:MAG: GyrI-like domain-containing protein [Oscillospiraceae bacterium]|nr:GyrI-like domain-containing protein [Oscillospiraceae bacterium]
MDMRFENKTAFYVSGYSVETSEATLEQDCAMLREKYEDKLRSISNHLYFIAWMTKENVMIYHFGVETPNQAPATEGATCIEVPATRFAVATVPGGAPILATWYEFFELFEKEVPALGGTTIDLEFPFHFESFDENGVCELCIPVNGEPNNG